MAVASPAAASVAAEEGRSRKKEGFEEKVSRKPGSEAAGSFLETVFSRNVSSQNLSSRNPLLLLFLLLSKTAFVLQTPRFARTSY